MSQTKALPTISLDPFFLSSSSQSEKRAAAAALNNACTTHGFFYLRLPPPDSPVHIPPDLLSAVLEQSKEWFTTATPDEKDAIRRKGVEEGGDGGRGYQKLGDNVTQHHRDHHEAIDFYRPVDNPTPGALLQGTNLFPPNNPSYKTTLETYWHKCIVLSQRIMVAFAWALGYEDTPDVLLNHTQKCFWVFRAIGYPPLERGIGDEDEGVSCGEHSDYGCLTLLLADDTKGALQVRDRSYHEPSADGGSSSGVKVTGGCEEGWIPADPLRNHLVVNIGDMLEVWSNGLWKSTRHRVVHRSGGYRVSVPFFYEPDWDARIAPLERCVEAAGGVRRYEERVYGEALKEKVGGNFYGGG